MGMDYKLRKNSGALNEVVQAPQMQVDTSHLTRVLSSGDNEAPVFAQGRDQNRMMAAPARRSAEPTRQGGWGGAFFYSVREGERVLVTIVCFRDGRQEHLAGPAHVWFDPTQHASIEKEDVLQIGAKEAIVVYSKDDPGSTAGSTTGGITRRLIHGPATFMPAPGEWLHTFAWHGTRGGQGGYHKVPNGLIFQKIWLMPDQMYHDVSDVRTADDAVLTVRLMIFFVLEDLPRMLETSHDPIGDFINAATSDVIAFTGRHSFDNFKKNIQKLNELETYDQLLARALQCGYRITKIVYRGYGAPESLQNMHDEAIESRTRLQLERATREQAQDLEDFTLERALARNVRQREEADQRREADLRDRLGRREAARAEELADAQQAAQLSVHLAEVEEKRLAGLRELGVDLTTYLCNRRIKISGVDK